MPIANTMRRYVAIVLIAGSVAACNGGAAGGDQDEIGSETFTGIAPEEVISLGGTEPFWGIEIQGDQLVYSTPEDIEGERTSVSRFAGNNGLGFYGELSEGPIEIAVTPGECSDGMSDRTYPYTATVALGEATLFGCGHTDRQSYTGGE